jgi:hypothetical protein
VRNTPSNASHETGTPLKAVPSQSETPRRRRARVGFESATQGAVWLSIFSDGSSRPALLQQRLSSDELPSPGEMAEAKFST